MKIAHKAALVLLLTAVLGFIATAIYQRNVVAFIWFLFPLIVFGTDAYETFIAAPRRARLFDKYGNPIVVKKVEDV